MIIQSADKDRPFRCQVDAFDLAVGETVTEFDFDEHDRVMAYLSESLKTTKRRFLGNGKELVGLDSLRDSNTISTNRTLDQSLTTRY